jgi:hypothetical protein
MADEAEDVERAALGVGPADATVPDPHELFRQQVCLHTGIAMTDMENKLMRTLEENNNKGLLVSSQAALVQRITQVTDPSVRRHAARISKLLRDVHEACETLRIFPDLATEQRDRIRQLMLAASRGLMLMYSGCMVIEDGLYAPAVAEGYVHNLFNKATALVLDTKFEHFDFLTVDSKIADKIADKLPATPVQVAAVAPPQYHYQPQQQQYYQQQQHHQPQPPQEPHPQRAGFKRSRVCVGSLLLGITTMPEAAVLCWAL